MSIFLFVKLTGFFVAFQVLCRLMAAQTALSWLKKSEKKKENILEHVDDLALGEVVAAFLLSGASAFGSQGLEGLDVRASGVFGRRLFFDKPRCGFGVDGCGGGGVVVVVGWFFFSHGPPCCCWFFQSCGADEEVGLYVR